MKLQHSKIGVDGSRIFGRHRGKAAIITALLSLSSAVPGLLQAGLVTHLSFDNAADLGQDSSGNNNHAGVNASPSFSATGISGGSADLTTTHSYFNFLGEENPVENTLEGAFTYSIWVNTTQTFASEGSNTYQGAAIIYADVYGTPGGSQGDAIPMALVGSKLGVVAGNQSQTELRSTSDINTGQWVHLVVTRDLTADVSLYVNGQLQDSAPNMSITDLSGRNELVLGGNLIDGRYYSGLLDDFQAYNRPLTDAEVLFLYNNPGSTVPDPPLGDDSFVITHISGAENGDVSLSWPVPDGVTDPLALADKVERSGTLLPASWSDITSSGAVTIVAGVASFTDTDPLAGGKAFYRIAR